MDGRNSTTRKGSLLLATAALIVALLALPAVGHAAVITFGSDLSKPANLSEARGPDVAFWNPGQPVPASGQITQLRLKGIAVPSAAPGAPSPLTQFHFQVLHPGADGSVSVSLSTNPMDLPAGGDPNQITTYTPQGYLCAKKGDYVDFNDEGGFVPDFYPGGVPYQVFSSAPGATTSWYSQNNGTNIGAVFSGQPRSGEELLLQAVLKTDGDASPVCGGRKGKIYTGLQIAKGSVTVRRGFVPVRVTCPGVAQGRCQGSLNLTAAGTVIGSIGLWVKPTTTINLHVRLSKAGQKLLKKSKRLTVSAGASTVDLSGGRVNTRAPLVLHG